MSKRFEGALNALVRSRSYEELGGVLMRTIRALGYACYSYLEIRPLWYPGEPEPFYLTTLSPEFVRGYIEKEFLPHDPLVIRATSTTIPFLWSSFSEFHSWMRPRRGRRGKGERLFEFAHECGYTEAQEIPLHAVDRRGRPVSALISLYWQRDPSRLTQPKVTPIWLRLVAAYFHERVLDLRSQRGTDPEGAPPSLSDRERECLLWACRGKTRGETANILKVSERTIEFHFETTLRKLGVHNKCHAVATAIHLGLICP